jgi:hypothetical protein
MRQIRNLGVAALVVALAAAVSSVRAADENKKKDHAIHGVVIKIEKDGDKDTGTFTVKTGGKNAKTGEETPVEEKTFKVTAATTFAKVSHKKKDKAATAAADAKAEPESTPATFADLKEGDVAAVEAKDGVAVSVKFHAPGKKKPAA